MSDMIESSKTRSTHLRSLNFFLLENSFFGAIAIAFNGLDLIIFLILFLLLKYVFPFVYHLVYLGYLYSINTIFYLEYMFEERN